jgi:hypothetical protein
MARAGFVDRFLQPCAGAAGLACLAIGTQLLCGCIVIPKTSELQSRGLLAEGVPAFLVPGKTTREEVRAALGPATAESDGGARQCYRASDHTLTIEVIFQGGQSSGPVSADIRRLVLYFHPHGILDRYEYDNVNCHRPFGTWNCKDSAGQKPPTKAQNSWEVLSCYP